MSYEKISQPTAQVELSSKSKMAIDNVISELKQSNSLQNYDGMMDRVSFYLGELVSGLGSPSLSYREWKKGELLFAEDYNDAMRECISDLSSIHNDIHVIGSYAVNLFQFGQSVSSKLREKLATLDVSLRKKEGDVYSNASGYFLPPEEIYHFSSIDISSFIENFTNLDYTDTSQSTVTVDTAGSYVTLSRSQDNNIVIESIAMFQDLMLVAVPSMFPGIKPTGIPGNNMELTGTALSFTPTNDTPQVSLVSNTDPHNDLFTIMDGDPSTWFEYERCNLISNPLPLVKCGSAWISNDGGVLKDLYQVIYPDKWSVLTQVMQSGDIVTMSAIGDPPANILGVTVILNLQQARRITRVDISPAIFDRGRTHNFYVTDIRLLNENNESISKILSVPVRIDSTKSFIMPPTNTKAIWIRLIDPSSPYRTLLGHYFVEATTTTTTTSSDSFLFGLFGGSSTETSTATFRVETTDKAYALNSQSGGSTSILWGVWSSADQSTTQLANLVTGYDVFKGRRWAIGLKGIDAFQTQYELTGDLISNPFIFKKPLTAAWIIPYDSQNITNIPAPYLTSLGDKTTQLGLGAQESDAGGAIVQGQSSSSIGVSFTQVSAFPAFTGPNVKISLDVPGGTGDINATGTLLPKSEPPVGVPHPDSVLGKTQMNYFLSANGSPWIQVDPYVGGGTGFPTQLDFTDTQYKGQDITNIRVRIQLLRDDSEPDDAGYTPVLNGYRLVGVFVGEKND